MAALPELIYTQTGTVVGNPAIYWADKQASAIRRVNTNNLKVENIITNVPDASAIALDLTRGQIYWTETDTGKIRRANLNGSNVQDLITGLTGPLSIALDLVRGKIYWTTKAGTASRVLLRQVKSNAQISTVQMYKTSSQD